MSSSYPPGEPVLTPAVVDKDNKDNKDNDEMSPDSLRKLHAMLAESEASIARGEPSTSWDEMLEEWRREDEANR